MKRLKKSALVFIFLALIAMQGSSESYYDYYAVYMDRDDLKKSVSYMETGREMKNLGKIYYKHPYLFVNEKYKGVHIIDNTDPAHPVKKGFITAPGCLDMAVKDKIIYLDNAIDLVSFDLNTMSEISRELNVFPEPASPGGYVHYETDRPANLILVEWVKY
jgi:hypothetical protein